MATFDVTLHDVGALRYQSVTGKDAPSDELLHVAMRYKAPDGDKSSDNATASDAKDAKDAKASSSDESTEPKPQSAKSAVKKDADEANNAEDTEEISVAKSKGKDAEETA